MILTSSGYLSSGSSAAARSDKLPGRLLQSLAKEITPVVHFYLYSITLYWRITY